MNKIIGLVITALVSVIVLAAVLIPVINDATTTEDKFTNEGVFYMGKFTPDDEYTLTFTGTGGVLTVNGEQVPTVNASSRFYSVISSDNFSARYGYSSNIYFLQLVGKDTSNNTFADGGVATTITISDGNLSISSTKSDNTTISKTVAFTEMYAIVPSEDDAIMKQASSDVYIKGDSEIYATGLTQVTAWSNMFHFEGTYDDGITISSPNLPDATYDNIKWNIEPVDGYIDLYKLTSIEFDITNNGTTVHATYSYFGVPSEVTAERSQHLSPAEIEILDILPVFIIIAVLIAAVAVVAFRRE